MRDANCLVIGGGIGGAAAAAALAQRGFKVDLVERNSADAVLGVGINLPFNALRAARTIRVLDQCVERGHPQEGRALMDHLGNEDFTEVFEVAEGMPRECGIPRPEMSRILLGAGADAGVRIRHECSGTVQETGSDSTVVGFTDGSFGQYDLVAAFDGIRSQTRTALWGRHDPEFSGYGVLRLIAPRPAELHRILQLIGPRNKAGLVPISDESLYLFLVIDAPSEWRPSPSELVERLGEELVDYGGIVAAIRDDLTDDSEIVYSPIEEVSLPTPWHRGTVVVGGDAAHAFTPHLTQGGAQALEDAVVLADEMAEKDSVTAALEAFTARRAPRAARVQQLARDILDGETDADPGHREVWPAKFGRLMGEAKDLLASPA
jgi:2-polyprenyl-6-methoxyphenol hydroxylase-like FAD-dependent oxidoreductase